MKSFLDCRYGGTVLIEEGEGRDWVCLSGFKSFMLHEKFFIFFSLCFFFLKYCTDVKNCGSFKGFGYIYIYIFIDKSTI